jgi:DNA (cytosine-5)-methyltransferase 1
MTIQVLDLFSGIGGIAEAFRRAGAEHVALCEIDKDCRKVLRKRFEGVEIIEDVKEVTKERIGERVVVDVVAGGSPCQDFSLAGLRKGLAGERSGLWFEFLRIVAELKVRWVVFENVPGLISSWTTAEPPPCAMEVRDFDSEEDAQRWADSMARDWTVEEDSDLETIISGLTELGYCVAMRSFDAQYFGVAQRRERVFIVASFGNAGACEVLFESDSRAWDSAPSREQGQRIAETLRSGAALRSAGASQTADGMPANLVAGFGLIGNGEYAESPASLTATGGDCGGGSEHLITSFKKRGGFGWSEDADITATLESEGGTHQGGQERIPLIAFGGGNCSGPIEVSTGCSTRGGLRQDFDTDTFVLAMQEDNQNGLFLNDIAGTLRSDAPGHQPCGTLVFQSGVTIHGTDKTASVASYTDIAGSLRTKPPGSLRTKPPGSQENSSTTAVLAFRAAGQEGFQPSDVAPPITASEGGGSGSPTVQGAFGVRRLTPLECERLQGMPDDWTRHADDGSELSDSARYRMIGNSVAVPVVEWIARRLVEVDARMNAEKS